MKKIISELSYFSLHKENENKQSQIMLFFFNLVILVLTNKLIGK